MSSPASSIGKLLRHYRIIEEIGAGGKGIVYRARDEHLRRDVAVKVLAAGMLADDTARKRFRKEALTLSRLNHPNIATVFDFDTQDGTDFLVSEYIDGVSLDTKLAKGPLPEKEIISLSTQLAKGLGAAHQSGVIHGDLKPGNLRVTADARMKILDFGLAQWMPHPSELGLTETLTGTCEPGGTLPYMAPEQFRGSTPDVRSDTWAVGAVLYEMATGKRPFIEPTAPQLVNAILSKQPPSPKALNPEVSVGLEKLILKALEKDPSRRYQSAGVLTADLERIEGGLSPAVASAVSARRATIAIVVLLVVGLGFAGFLAHRRSQLAKHSLGLGGSRRSVAVLGFKNLGGHPDKAWVSTAISEMLTTELAAGEQLRMVPGESVALVKANLSLPDADGYAPETLDKIRRQTSADDIVLGSYLDLETNAGGKLRIDLKLQDALAGGTIAAISEEGRESDLPAVVSRVATKLRSKLGAGAINPAEAAETNAAIPATADALRFYSEGLAKLRVFDGPSAVQLLQRAVAADPHNALAHAALSQAWAYVGESASKEEAKKASAESDEEARKAFAESAGLSRESRLWIEARYREVNKEWDKAQKIYKTLYALHPDNLEYGLKLVGHQGQSDDEALEMLQKLRNLPPPAGDDPRIDLQEAMFALSTPGRALAAAEKAEKKADALGARFIIARALEAQGIAYLMQQQMSNAENTFLHAKQVYAALGDQQNVLTINTQLMGVAMVQGNRAEVKKLSDENGGIRHELGLDTGPNEKFSAELRVAGELAGAGDYEAALNCYRQALEMVRKQNPKERDSKSYELWSLEGIARMEEQLGDVTQANMHFDEALALRRSMGAQEKGLMIFDLTIRAQRMLDQGNFKEARKSLHEALNIADRTHDKGHGADVFDGFGDLSLEEDRLGESVRYYEQALAIRAELGNAEDVVGTRLELAAVAIERDDPPSAESAAREALDLARKDSNPRSESSAETVLADALLAQGRYPEAVEAIENAKSFYRKLSSHRPPFDLLILEARIDTALNKTEGAEKSLNELIATATKTGKLRYVFQAGLALGECEMKAGKTASGQKRLLALEKDAKAKGFNRIARKAAAAAKA